MTPSIEQSKAPVSPTNKTSSSSTTFHPSTKLKILFKIPSATRSLLRMIQIVLIISIIGLYICELSGHFHPDPTIGGEVASAVRRFYHKEIEKIPIAEKRILQTDSEIHLNSNIGGNPSSFAEVVMENGVATKEGRQGLQEEYDNDICEYALEASRIRREARYSSRQRGSLLFRIFLHLRDVYVYGETDFDYDKLVEKRRRKDCHEQWRKELEGNPDLNQSEFQCNPPTKKELCSRIYESAKRSNESYNNALKKASITSMASINENSEDSDSDSEEHHVDIFFHTFTGFPGFVVEISIAYMFMCVILGTGFRVVDLILTRKIEGFDTMLKNMESGSSPLRNSPATNLKKVL